MREIYKVNQWLGGFDLKDLPSQPPKRSCLQFPYLTNLTYTSSSDSFININLIRLLIKQFIQARRVLHELRWTLNHICG